MILEHAVLNVVTGRECEFEQAFAEAQLIISSMAGYQSHALMKCHELGKQVSLVGAMGQLGRPYHRLQEFSRI